MNFKEYIQSLPDNYLYKAYEECIQFQDTGFLIDGNVRELYSQWKLMYNDTISVDVIEKYIFQEMARRYYNESKGAGCECCNGDEALVYKDNINNAFVDDEGNMLVCAMDEDLEFKVKFCPNCGKKF